MIAPSFETPHWEQLVRTARSMARCGREDAEDLVQDLLSRLLDTGKWEALCLSAESDRHLVRKLLVCLRREAINRHRHQKARKRRGWTERVSLDEGVLAVAPGAEPSHDPRRYMRVEEIVADGEAQLRKQFRSRGREHLFEGVRELLVADRESPCVQAIARRCGVTAGTLRVNVCRARRQLRDYVRERAGFPPQNSRSGKPVGCRSTPAGLPTIGRHHLEVSGSAPS